MALWIAILPALAVGGADGTRAGPTECGLKRMVSGFKVFTGSFFPLPALAPAANGTARHQTAIMYIAPFILISGAIARDDIIMEGAIK